MSFRVSIGTIKRENEQLHISLFIYTFKTMVYCDNIVVKTSSTNNIPIIVHFHDGSNAPSKSAEEEI